ncbi:exosome complex component RRP46-like [Amphibalanus amphitrite]|uniref:exosome complex component RRP46-like n=1 Tax=Amphibalanus amphitrite TaxID=1232801 RepID=UPI001C8FF009|nr:exosome complex component RRP46-like [Amphibalanus amphitrite]
MISADMKSEEGDLDEDAINNFTCELGVLSQCDGSATLCNGLTAVLAATFGPVEVRQQRELVDRSSIEVTFRGPHGVEGVEDRRVEQLVRSTLEQCVFAALHPRTAVSVVLNVLETDDLLLLSTCVNAAVLALLDSSLSMKYLPAAVTCVPVGDRVLVNPLPSERQGSSGGSVTAVYDTGSERLVACRTAGQLSAEQLTSCLREARRAAALVRQLYRRAVAAKFSKEPRDPWAGPSRAEDMPPSWRRLGGQQAGEQSTS